MKPVLSLFVVVLLEAHVIHIVDGVVHRVQCLMVVSVFIITFHCSIDTWHIASVSVIQTFLTV